MTDTFYMLILMENLCRDYIVWDQAAQITFVSPGKGVVHAEFKIDQAMLDDIRQHTASGEKYLPKYQAAIYDDHGTLIAQVEKTLYIRRKSKAQLAAATP